MEPVDIIITVLGAALIVVGGSVFKSFLHERTEQRKAELGTSERRAQLDHLEFMTEQETDRMKIITSAMQERPLLVKVDEKAALLAHDADIPR